MRILVTGVTGFIGSELLTLLLENFSDAEILCCVRNRNHVGDRMLMSSKVRLCEGINENDISNFNPEFVIHLAAYNTSNEENGDIDALVESNIRFGLHLLGALRKTTALKLFVNTGSFSQYTSNGDAYLYSASKSAFEIFLKYYCKSNSWKYITVVPYSVYGGQKTIKRIIDYIVESVDAIEPIDLSPGYQELDFIHVYDVASFYVSAIKNYSLINNGSIFHIGTGKPTSIRQLSAVVQNILGGKCNINWGGKKYRHNDIMYACAESQQVRDSIWSPKYDLLEGLKDYLLKKRN